jgi:cytosine deaminase
MTNLDEIRAVFDFVTENAANALRLEGYGVKQGCRADLNVLAAPTIQHVLRLQQPPAWVIAGGRILAHNDVKREIKWPLEMAKLGS